MKFYTCANPLIHRKFAGWHCFATLFLTGLVFSNLTYGQTTENDSARNEAESRLRGSANSGVTARERAAQLRQPTAPTDAQQLSARPPKPEFIRPKDGQVRDRYDLTFDDLAFEIPEGQPFNWSMLTPEVHQYDGKKITLRGYIKPSFKQRNIQQFVFVRDNQECCFGPGAALFDCVLVKLADGRETNYTVRPVTVEGEFYIRKYAGPDGNVWAIYRMRDARVK